jgi:hypothetical protein
MGPQAEIWIASSLALLAVTENSRLIVDDASAIIEV